MGPGGEGSRGDTSAGGRGARGVLGWQTPARLAPRAASSGGCRSPRAPSARLPGDEAGPAASGLRGWVEVGASWIWSRRLRPRDPGRVGETVPPAQKRAPQHWLRCASFPRLLHAEGASPGVARHPRVSAPQAGSLAGAPSALLSGTRARPTQGQVKGFDITVRVWRAEGRG